MMVLRSSLLRPAMAWDSMLMSSRSRVCRVSAARGFISSTALRSESPSSVLYKTYFSANNSAEAPSVKNGLFAKVSAGGDGSGVVNGTATTTTAATTTATATATATATETQSVQELPHRRRKRLKEEAEKNSEEQTMAPDAPARLSAYSSALPTTSLRRTLAALLALCKPNLSFLIVLSTTSAYGMYPISSLLTLDPAMTPLPTLSTSTLTLFYLTAGTFLSCCSANTINMLLEPKHDAKMSRTRNRPLVRGLLSTRTAILFAIATAASGLGLLYIGTNPTTTGLSAANILLYGFVYTPLKRVHAINTWVGAVVGGIPPLMGWVAAAGQTATTGHDTWRDMLFSEDSIGGWLLAGVLFAWQFPHFNSLSHIIREEYKAAGHQMLCWKNPAMNARVALRYSILMFPISIGLWWVGVVGHGFLVSSTLANGWLVKEAYKFWKHQGAKGTARGLFWASVWQLPILMVGGLVTKKGLWDGVWQNAFGSDQPDDEDDVYLDDDEEAIEDAIAASIHKQKALSVGPTA